MREVIKAKWIIDNDDLVQRIWRMTSGKVANQEEVRVHLRSFKQGREKRSEIRKEIEEWKKMKLDEMRKEKKEEEEDENVGGKMGEKEEERRRKNKEKVTEWRKINEIKRQLRETQEVIKDVETKCRRKNKKVVARVKVEDKNEGVNNQIIKQLDQDETKEILRENWQYFRQRHRQEINYIADKFKQKNIVKPIDEPRIKAERCPQRLLQTTQSLDMRLKCDKTDLIQWQHVDQLSCKLGVPQWRQGLYE